MKGAIAYDPLQKLLIAYSQKGNSIKEFESNIGIYDEKGLLI